MAIDYVVPMVFSDSDDVRFRSWGTEEVLIDLVRKNMPWARISILLSDESQYREWMRDVRVVYHRDFIPEGLLPVHNACTIEMFLHRIPELSEYIVYGNDDMFPLSPLEEADFFRDGLPCQHMEEKPFPERYNVFHMFVKNGQDMIAADFGRRYDTWLSNGHSMAAILRSTMENVWERHEGEILDSLSDYRSPDNLNQYIYCYWQHFTGYVDYMPRHTFVSAEKSVEEIMDAIDGGGIVCINDSRRTDEWEMKRDAILKSLINVKLDKRNTK